MPTRFPLSPDLRQGASVGQSEARAASGPRRAASLRDAHNYMKNNCLFDRLSDPGVAAPAPRICAVAGNRVAGHARPD